jgi:hypothetical protein
MQLIISTGDISDHNTLSCCCCSLVVVVVEECIKRIFWHFFNDSDYKKNSCDSEKMRKCPFSFHLPSAAAASAVVAFFRTWKPREGK